jgi:hypothetical protein
MLRIAASLALLLLAAPALGRTTTAAATTASEGADDFPSLQGGESLHGSSTLQAMAGFATLGVAFGQGMTARDDLGLSAELTWSTTELVLGGFWRRQLGQARGWELASRLSAGWYVDGGSRLIYDSNRSDRGLQLAPGLALSSRGLGLFSVSFDLPLTITTWRGAGFWIAPRVAVSYEAALYDQMALGVRGSLAWRGGAGGAPMRAGQVLPELLVTATWKVF